MHGRGRGRGGAGPVPGRGWVRGGAPVAAPKVWRRDATAAPGAVPQPVDDGARKRGRAEEEAAVEGSAGRPADPAPAAKRQAPADAEVKAALDAKLHEAEKLRKQIEEKNRLLAEQRAALKRATEAQEKAAADEVAHKEKSRKLAAGFSAAVQRVTVDRSTQGGRAAGGASAGPEAARRAADEAEVTRVLGSLTDADVLGLPPRPGADVVKQAYRTLAKKLHPDKCTAPRAKDAFQRVHKAYQRLNGDGAAAGRA